MELPAFEANVLEQSVQLVTPLRLEYVFTGQLLHCPFTPNLPAVQPTQADDVLLYTDPPLHKHEAIVLNFVSNALYVFAGHDVHAKNCE
jgi:hypothetical protein